MQGMLKTLGSGKVSLIQWERHVYHKKYIGPLKDEVDFLSSNNFLVFIVGSKHYIQVDGNYWNDYYDPCYDDGIVKINRIPPPKNKEIPESRPECINLIAINRAKFSQLTSY